MNTAVESAEQPGGFLSLPLAQLARTFWFGSEEPFLCTWTAGTVLQKHAGSLAFYQKKKKALYIIQKRNCLPVVWVIVLCLECTLRR